ncbi:MAG: hypothetical protein GX545_02465 [Fibrobacter sp.]|nr:hypothetical protein [Fibrobacter sp.]
MKRRLITILFFLIGLISANASNNVGAFSKYMSPEGGINPMTGTIALQKDLASISVGQIGTRFILNYSGNVFKDVKTKNEEISSGIVGLGWSLGRSQIVCDCKENAFLDDDIYYLITAEGNRYKIFDQIQWRKNLGIKALSTSTTENWVIEGNPYWKIERIVGESTDASIDNTIWKYVKGWKITDTEGIIHTYGDINEANTLFNPIHKATEYDLIWLSYMDGEKKKTANGYMESTLGGASSYYPVAWNLSKEEDLDGNTLVYDYLQIMEGLEGRFKETDGGAPQKWRSHSKYTKENYLTGVYASDGSHIKFSYEDKGTGDFEGEYIDNKGDEFEPEEGSDMFKEKIVRKYLTQIDIYGPQKKVDVDNFIGKVTLCYSPLQKGTPYVKRLLSSIRFFNKDQKEIDYENYSYYTDVEQSKTIEDKSTAYPLGALHSIKGKNCGWVEYTYWYESMGSGHVEELPLKKIFGRGLLEDGTNYLVGENSDSELMIYTRQLGKWVLAPGKAAKNINSVSFGDAGWFLALKEGEKETTSYVYQWNGKEWQTVCEPTQYTTHFDSPLDITDPKTERLVAGPDYVLKYTLDDKKGAGINDGFLKISLVWSKWGGVSTNYFILDDIEDNDGSGFLVYPNKNQILVVYQDGGFFCTGNCLGYKVYDIVNGIPKEGSDFGNGFDSENSIIFNGSTLLDAGEGTSFYNYSRVQLFNWNGNDYVRQLRYSFSNTDPANVVASGDDYYVVRYSDNRFIRIFEFDGSSWNPEALFEKLLKSWSMNKKYYWAGVGGNDFIVTGRAYQRKWYTTMHKESRAKLFHKKNGSWEGLSLEDELGNSDQRSFIVGNDWFLEHRKSHYVWIWDGTSWVKENLEKELNGYEMEDIYSLGGDMFAASSENKTKIFHKVNNSFSKTFGAYLVREKRILEPVTDQVLSYKYSFLSSGNKDNYIDYDPISNSPMMDVMKVELPNGAGIVERYLCLPPNNGVDENVAVGNVCREVQIGKEGSGIISESRTKYIRDRKDADLYPVYVDKPSQIVQISRGLKTVTKNSYSPKNGLIQKVEKKIGNRTTEEVYRYVNDYMFYFDSAKPIVDQLNNQNRINVLAGSYSCMPNCSEGMVVSGTANGMELVNNNYVTTSSWKYTPKKKNSQAMVDSYISYIAFANTSFVEWEQQSHNTKYVNNQVVETEEGPRKIKVASFLENKNNGKMYGNTANCGIDEGLMLSGESCNIVNWNNCEIEELAGYAIDLEAGSDLSNYGRFSKKVLKLNSSKVLSGNILKARNEKYRFSAWVQYTINDEKLTVSINGQQYTWNTKPKDLKDVGKWHNIEWFFDLTGGTATVSLETNSTSSIHLQDIRVLPVKATSTASFWNDEWDKIQTTVDNRGIGSYVKFDRLGREIETYSETAERNVYLASRTTIVDGNCSEYPNGSDLLKNLKLNGKFNVIPTGNNYEATYSLSDVSVSVDFETLDPSDNVRYRLYATGSSGKWESSCCGKLSYPVISFAEAKSWILEIDVFPYDSKVYKFNIKKKENDWVEYGDITGFAYGKAPKYQSNLDSSKIVYKDKYRLLHSADYTGNNWNVPNTALFTNEVSEFFPAVGKYQSYLTYVPEIEPYEMYLEYPRMFYKSGTTWNQYNDSKKKLRVSDVKLLENASNNLVLLYNRNLYVSDEVGNNGKFNLVSDNSLCTRVWNNSKSDFDDLGSTPVFDSYNTTADIQTKSVNVSLGNITSYKTGVVEDGEVFASDIVVGPNNKLFVAYLANSKMLKNDALEENDDVASSYSVPFVYIKQLYEASENSSGKQIWSGVSQKNNEPIYYGDVLSWTDNIFDAIENVDRIKLASDGTNLYLAVIYEMNLSDDEEENDEEKSGVKSYKVLTVFKGEILTNATVNGQFYNRYLKWNTLKDNSIKTAYHSKSVQKEQEIVAYLNENDDFDFEVRKNVPGTSESVPYIMFRNSENNNMLSVISYRNNRWLSVGNPAFAYPQKYQESADLGVNEKGNPFIIFHSSKPSQKNKIVGMHYNQNNALDLTLSAFETNDLNFNASCAFRQYILNYKANVVEANEFSFKATPRTPTDLKEIQLYNKNGLIKAYNNYSDFVSVPIAEGVNNIEVRIVGKDESILSYNLKLNRKKRPNPFYGIVSSMAVGITKIIDANTLEINIVPTVIDPSINVITFDIHFESGWIFVFDGVEHVVPGTIEIPIDKLPADAKFINEEGEVVNVILINPAKIDPSFDPEELPWYVNPIGDDEDDGEGDDIPNPDISENVPKEIRGITSAMIYATGNINIADRVSVAGDVFAGAYVNIGVTTSTTNNIYSGNSILLRNRANVNNVYYVNVFEIQDGATYKSATKLNVLNVPPLPTYSVNYGSSEIIVEPQQSINMSAGSYKDFMARSETTVYFEAGDYYFKSFYTDSKVNMIFAPGTRIWIAENLRLGNENKLQQNDKKGDLFVYVGQNVSVETMVQINAVIVAPNADMRLSSGCYVRGYLFAKSLDVQPECVIE